MIRQTNFVYKTISIPDLTYYIPIDWIVRHSDSGTQSMAWLKLKPMHKILIENLVIYPNIHCWGFLDKDFEFRKAFKIIYFHILYI